MPHLAVIIVSWNVRGLLTACLRSLLADLDGVEHTADVWVVDNASVDGTAEMVAQAFPDVHLIACDDNLGFVKANNLALRRVIDRPTLKYVWLLNPDTEVQPGATAALIQALESGPRVGMAGPRLLNPDGSLQHSAFHFPGLVQLAIDLFPFPARWYDTRLNGRYPRAFYQRETPFLIDHPLGASMMVRAGAIAEVGLMDEDFFMYCEEVDWCWRMKEAGWQILCAPTALVIHHAGQSSSQVRVSSFVNLWKSRARLYARHYGPLKRRLASALVQVGMVLRRRKASPDMAQACREIVHVWREAASQ